MSLNVTAGGVTGTGVTGLYAPVKWVSPPVLIVSPIYTPQKFEFDVITALGAIIVPQPIAVRETVHVNCASETDESKKL